MFGWRLDPWRVFEGKWCFVRLYDGLSFEGTIKRVSREHATLREVALQESEIPGVKPVTFCIASVETVICRQAVQLIRESNRESIEKYHAGLNRHRATTPGQQRPGITSSKGGQAMQRRKIGRNCVALVFLLFAVALAACAARGLMASGEALDAVGQEFLAAGKAYDALLDQKAITADQYQSWATFAGYFKLWYPRAVGAWRLARASGDAVAMKSAEDAIAALRGQLLPFLAGLLPQKK